MRRPQYGWKAVMKIMITVQEAVYPAKRNALFCDKVRKKTLTVTDMVI